MYAKIFESIYHGSLRRDWKALIVFQQFLVLSDREGVVDRTSDAISSTTTIPIDIIQHGISELSKPDLESRSQEHDGRRIILISPHRTWGWQIVNYAKYRDIRSQDELRAYWRDGKQQQRRFEKPEFSELELYAAKIGLPVTEINKFFDHFESNGWKIGGKAPMRCWRAAMRTWKTNWHTGAFASARPARNGTTGIDKVVANDEYERVVARLRLIASAYGDHQTWREQDRVEHKKLRARRDELKKVLGITI